MDTCPLTWRRRTVTSRRRAWWTSPRWRMPTRWWRSCAPCSPAATSAAHPLLVLTTRRTQRRTRDTHWCSTARFCSARRNTSRRLLAFALVFAGAARAWRARVRVYRPLTCLPPSLLCRASGYVHLRLARNAWCRAKLRGVSTRGGPRRCDVRRSAMRRTGSSGAVHAPPGERRVGVAARLLCAATCFCAALLVVASAQLRAAATHAASPPAHEPMDAADAAPRAPAPLVAIADLHGDSANALKSLQLRRGAAAAPCLARKCPELLSPACPAVASLTPRAPGWAAPRTWCRQVTWSTAATTASAHCSSSGACG